MAVNSDTMKVSYVGDNTSTELAFSWTIYEDDDILVIDEVDATGVQSTLALNSDYSVTIDPSGGGTVTLEDASVTGHTYWLVCNIDNLQETEFTEGDKFPVDSIETALDKLTMQVIQLKDATDRSIKIPITEDTDQTLDDVAANRAKKALVFDDDGKITISTDDYEDQAANSAASAAAALASQISAAASEAAAAVSAAKLKGTSTTSLAIGTGSKTFVTQASKQFDVGVWLLITSDADETNFMHGQVTAYSGTSLVVNVTNVGGLGTLADWTITVAGTRGAAGATGATGTVAVVAAGGTVDAITADYTPDLVLANEPFVAFISAGANTSATPTFAPDGLTAHTIVKEGGAALVAGDIGAAGYVAIVKYALANTRWELVNPTTASVVKKTGSNLSGTLNEAKGTAIASAATCEIWSTDGNTVHITGTTTITSLGTALQAGCWKKLIFDDALILTNGANLILQGGANITTAAGDIAFVYADTTTQHRVIFHKKSGLAVIASTDEKIKVSADDTTAGYLNGKLTAGTAITLTEGSGGGNETLSIGVTAGTIGQTQLKSTTGEVSLFNTGDEITQVSTVLPGGGYGFTPQWKNPAAVNPVEVYASMLKSPTVIYLPTGYTSQIYLYFDRTGSGGDDKTLYVQQRYIVASPPYESFRKNDVVPLFVFGLVDKASGKIVATYIAPEPPWANNGPTVINPLGLIQRIKKQKSGINISDLKTGKTKPKDFGNFLENSEEPTPEELKAALAIKITQEDKNADMPLIPHPFASFDPAKQQVIVLSPTDAKFCYGLSRLHDMGESVSEVLHGDYITIDNTPMKGLVTPEIVMAVNARWKQT